MNEFMYNIGKVIVEFFYSIDAQNLKDALSIMGIGMLGIFIVTGVIIGVVTVLNKVFSK